MNYEKIIFDFKKSSDKIEEKNRCFLFFFFFFVQTSQCRWGNSSLLFLFIKFNGFQDVIKSEMQGGANIECRGEVGVNQREYIQLEN